MKVLVTGGTGFIGRSVVRRLIQDGYGVRVLARAGANVDAVVAHGAEVSFGDVTDGPAFGRAMPGCDAVVHLAAGTQDSEAASVTTLAGTRILIELCRQHRLERLVYVSSCSVYGVADYDENSVVTETSPLERFPERRGFYSASKRKAEEYVTEFMHTRAVPVVILRPGTVFGRGGDLFPGMMGKAVRSWYFVIGDGSLAPPFVHVDDVAEAISRCLDREEAEGEIFNVVDPERMTKRQYVDHVIRRVDAHARVVYVPFLIVCSLTWLQEVVCKIVGRRPLLTRYRLESSQKSVVFDGSKIAAKVGWKPARSLRDALSELVSGATPGGCNA